MAKIVQKQIIELDEADSLSSDDLLLVSQYNPKDDSYSSRSASFEQAKDYISAQLNIQRFDDAYLSAHAHMNANVISSITSDDLRKIRSSSIVSAESYVSDSSPALGAIEIDGRRTTFRVPLAAGAGQAAKISMVDGTTIHAYNDGTTISVGQVARSQVDGIAYEDLSNDFEQYMCQKIRLVNVSSDIDPSLPNTLWLVKDYLPKPSYPDVNIQFQAVNDYDPGTEGGSIDAVGGTYMYGDMLCATAVPALGYKLANWNYDESATSQKIRIRATHDQTISAIFTRSLKNIADAVADEILPQEFTMDPISVDVVLHYGDLLLNRYTHYDISAYENNVFVTNSSSRAKVIVYGLSSAGYDGIKEILFDIIPKEI